MSGVFHSVRTIAPGVPFVPKPPWPVFHVESSNSGFSQPSAGLSVVYRHSMACVAGVGDDRPDLGRRLVQLARAAAAICASSIFTIARS